MSDHNSPLVFPNTHHLESSGNNNTETGGDRMEVKEEHFNNQDESLVCQTQNISLDPKTVTTVAKKKTIEETIKGLENKIETLVQKYTEVLENETENNGRDEELIHQIDSVLKYIEVLQRSIPKNTCYKPTSVDLPGFQLRHQRDFLFPEKAQFGTVTQFLRQFEKVLEAGGYNVVYTWKRFIPLTLSLDLDAWLTNDLLLCDTWDEAKQLFQKMFGNSFAKVEARRAVFNMRIRWNENTTEYYLRFTKNTSEAGYKKDDKTLGNVYYNSLPTNWQTQIGSVLVARGIHVHNYTIDNVSDASNSIYGDKAPKDVPGTTVSQEINNQPMNQTKRRHTNEKKSTGDGNFFCAKCGGHNTTHNGSDCFSKTKRPKFLGNKNRPFKTTNNGCQN